LNLGPHPYQQNAGNRCAKRRSRRSHSTVEVAVMCSHSVQLCALIAPAAALLRTSAVLAVVVRVSVVVGTLTGPLGRLSAARLAVVPAAVGSGAYLPPVVCQREADLRRERRVGGAEVGEEGAPTRPCHCDCDPPSSCRPCTPSSPRRSASTTRPPTGSRRGRLFWSRYATATTDGDRAGSQA
jgi:hypothetical protein